MGEFPQLTINEILAQIYNGAIRIPSFQRGFVWEPDDTAFFMDSLYKRFPIGVVLIWRTKEQLHTERQLGRFVLPDPKDDYPIDYVLDGQQRLTSIFSVFQTQLTPQSDPTWIDIFYLFGSNSSPEQIRFAPLTPDQFDPTKHFPLSVLFNPRKYMEALKQVPEELVAEIFDLYAVFQSVQIPMQVMRTDDKGIVAIVFERINRAGVPLDTFQLLNAWSWSSEFDLQEKLEELTYELSDFAFDGLADDKDLLLKCFTGYILGKTSPNAITGLSGEQIRDNFPEIINGLKSTVDFFRNQLHLYSLEYVPYPAMIVALVKFFGTQKSNGVLYTELQRRQLVRWFWRSCFSRRYSSGVNSAHEADIAAMARLSTDENTVISAFKCEIPPDFFTSTFAMTSVNTKTFIALLASLTPRSFISGARVDLAETLKKASSKEFHHIFPDKYLQRSQMQRREIYQLANFCFLNNADNQRIKDKSPAEYCKYLPKDEIKQILDSALCPENTFEIDYTTFIRERVELLMRYANTLI